MPDLRVFGGGTFEGETCPVRFEGNDGHAHRPVFAIAEGHRLVMHGLIETHARRPEMHAADDGGGLQFRARRKDDGARNSVIREVGGVLHPVARFVTHILAIQTNMLAYQWMDLLGGFAGSFRRDRIVLDPVTCAGTGTWATVFVAMTRRHARR